MKFCKRQSPSGKGLKFTRGWMGCKIGVNWQFTAQRTTTTGKPPLQICPALPCSSDTCHAPACRCGSSDIPNQLDPEETPQMIVVTFENAINEWSYSVYDNILREERVNPNGCPITATFFVSHEWTDYSSVQTLYSKGHEIGVLGLT